MSLHTQVEEALALCDDEIAKLETKCRLNAGLDRNLRKRFKDGVHRIYAKAVLEFLKSKFPNHAELADELGVERSTVSRMLKNGRIDGPHFTYILEKYRAEIYSILPTEESALKGGYIEATSYVRKKWLREHDCEEEITPEELECLLRVLGSKPWRKAQENGDTAQVMRIGTKMLDEIHEQVGRPWRVKSVPVLEQTVADWREPFLLSLWTLCRGRG